MHSPKLRPAVRLSRITQLLVILALLAAAGALVQAPVAYAAACPGGNTITTNTTWSIDCQLTSGVTVNAGVTLTVSPGVTVRIDNYSARINVNGTLTADGGLSQPITFTTTDEGAPGFMPGNEWGGIVLGSSSAGHTLDYVNILYAGGNGAPGLDILTSSATISNLAVSNGNDEGIQLTAASPDISNATFSGNAGAALVLRDNSFPSLSNISYPAANGFDGAVVDIATLASGRSYTWGPAGQYYMQSDVLVESGTTLTVSPGTQVVASNRNDDLLIYGTLIAAGTSSARISFTSAAASPAPMDWGRIHFYPGSSGTLNYVDMAYGGGPGTNVRDATVWIESSNVTINNSSVRHSLMDGIKITNASPTISTTTLINNGVANYGRAIDLNGTSFPAFSELSASGNIFNGVAVNGATVAADYTWGDGGLSSYLVTADVEVASGATLTIVPGTTVYVDSPIVDLNVSGTLSAIGTVEAPIHFRSGDSFTNGGTPASEIGDWGQIEFMAGSSGTLEHVILEHAGGYLFPALAIASSNVLVRNSTIARNHDDGILVTAGAPRITLSNIEDNRDAGLRNTGSSTVIATCNWWGDASGPTVASNPGGSGQRIVGAAAFSPWLNDRVPAATCHTIFVPLLLR